MPDASDYSQSNLYGSAHLVTETETNVTDIFSPAGYAGFPLGHNPKHRGTGLNFDFTQHAGHGLFIGATRSGKFVNILAPALLTCTSSCVVIDPKGESAWVTAPRQEALGKRVIYLDPWGEIQRNYGDKVGETLPITRFNPIGALDPKSPDFADDVMAIADALVISDDANSHWVASAKNLIAGLIAAVVEENPGKASLRDVRELITADDEVLLAQVLRIRAANPNSLAARKLRRFAPKPRVSKDGTPKPMTVSGEITSIRSTAETQTDILDSESLLSSMETDTPPFDLSELVTGKIALYLVLPPDRLTTHGRWLRLILTLALKTISRMGPQSADALPVCLFLDEMSALHNLAMVEDSFGLMAGMGIRIFGFLQDLSQLKRDYQKSWETFISNSSVIQLLQCADDTTARYFSDYLGTRTVVVNRGFSKHTRPTAFTNTAEEERVKKVAARAQRMRNYMGNETGTLSGPSLDKYSQEVWEADLTFHPRAVMLPQEVREADPSKSIIILPGKGNFQLPRWTYYDDPILSKWARHDPNKPLAKIETPPVSQQHLRFDKDTGKPLTPSPNPDSPRFDKETGQRLY